MRSEIFTVNSRVENPKHEAETMKRVNFIVAVGSEHFDEKRRIAHVNEISLKGSMVGNDDVRVGHST